MCYGGEQWEWHSGEREMERERGEGRRERERENKKRGRGELGSGVMMWHLLGRGEGSCPAWSRCIPARLEVVESSTQV